MTTVGDAHTNPISTEFSVTAPGNDQAAVAARIDHYLDQLRATIELRDDQVAIPGTDVSLLVTRPASIDALLEGAADDPEQNLPYWAELWPSGIALAAAILREPEAVRGQPVLELGSGVGITAAVALGAGADLLATDYSPESLLLTRITALRHCGREPRTLRVNWRQPAAEWLDARPCGYPVVLAADVLYERRDIQPLLDLFDRIVAPDGSIWLAEPGRPPASIFLETASRQGWSFTSTAWTGPWPDPGDADVVARVHLLRRR